MSGIKGQPAYNQNIDTHSCQVYPRGYAPNGTDGETCETWIGSHSATAGGGIGGNHYSPGIVPDEGEEKFVLNPPCSYTRAAGHGPHGTPSENNGGLNCHEALGIGSSTGLYNYAFVWSIPYATNTLAYGEAGNEGEYKTIKLNKIDGPIEINLGVGGVWNSANITGDGQNGTNTTVRLKDRNNSNSILAEYIANGGKGGKNNLFANSYDLCYANAGICHLDSTIDDEPNTNCCNNENNSRTTKEILNTSINLSAFEGIKSQVGNSEIIGIGLGRGAEGMSSRASI